MAVWRTSVVLVIVLGAAHAQWWGSAVYYRVLVDSFKDIDGDGLGDIKGVTKQLSYVKAVGADSIILSPLVTRSPDCGAPGAMDLTEIDPRYGRLDDFYNLLEKAKKLELKVVVTIPLRTMSIASEWFNSSAAKLTGYEDRFIWSEERDSPTPVEEISWIQSDIREGYYAASPNKEALLNFCSESTMAALSAAPCAWIRRGVNGVLLNPDFKTDQTCGEKLLKKMAAEGLGCARAAGLEIPAILVESSLPPLEAAAYYADNGVGAFSILSNVLSSPERKTAPELALSFQAALLSAPQDMKPSWLTSAPNDNRITTRYGTEMIDAINLLTLTLPGAVIIQQGDELGAADTILDWANNYKCWPNMAVASSAPFPWDETTNGGFSSGEPWMPLTPNYRYANAKAEFANDLSHIGVVRVAAAMRKSPAMGPHSEITRLNGAVAVLRWGNAGSLLVVANVAKDQTEVQLSRIPGLPTEMTVAASSSGSSLSPGSHVVLEKTLKLSTGETILLAGPPRHCGGPGPVDKIANKLSEGWQKINKYFSSL